MATTQDLSRGRIAATDRARGDAPVVVRTGRADRTLKLVYPGVGAAVASGRTRMRKALRSSRLSTARLAALKADAELPTGRSPPPKPPGDCLRRQTYYERPVQERRMQDGFK